MKVKHTRPSPDGGGFGVPTDSKVEELADVDGQPATVPDGAVQVDDDTPVHDWQRVLPGGRN